MAATAAEKKALDAKRIQVLRKWSHEAIGRPCFNVAQLPTEDRERFRDFLSTNHPELL